MNSASSLLDSSVPGENATKPMNAALIDTMTRRQAIRSTPETVRRVWLTGIPSGPPRDPLSARLCDLAAEGYPCGS